MTTISNPVPRRSWGLSGDSTRGLIGKIVLLGLVAGLAAAMAVPLISGKEWLFLGILILSTVGIFVVYLQPWHIPIKYLVPGTNFLIAFQVIPVMATFATAFTNFGDGHAGPRRTPHWPSRPRRSPRSQGRPNTS